VGWFLLLLGAIGLVLFSSRYFARDPEAYFPRQREVYIAHSTALIIHIAAMVPAALLGPFQFLRPLRERYPRVHRMTGRVYLAAALVGALGGLYLAPYSASGLVSDVSFTFLGLGVLFTSATAYLRIRAGNVQSHREWMTRSYSLIFAAVTLRVYAGPLELLFGEQYGYALTAWLCWVPNLLVAEWMIRGPLRERPEPPLTNAPGAPADSQPSMA
jgi:uncharacterized membrane protein